VTKGNLGREEVAGTNHQPERITSNLISCGLGDTTNNTAEYLAFQKGLNLYKPDED